MARLKTRPDPNVEDPLSESTVQRRLHAAYLASGYNRFSFAKALDISYSTLDAWDRGASMPTLRTLTKALDLLQPKFDLVGIVYGKRPPGKAQDAAAGASSKQARPSAKADPHMTDDEIMLLLAEVKATPAQRAAIGEHQASPAGKFQTWTREYVLQFLQAVASATEAGATPSEARQHANNVALNARAVSEAVEAGAQSVTLDDLKAALVREIETTRKKRSPPLKHPPHKQPAPPRRSKLKPRTNIERFD